MIIEVLMHHKKTEMINWSHNIIINTIIARYHNIYIHFIIGMHTTKTAILTERGTDKHFPATSLAPREVYLSFLKM